MSKERSGACSCGAIRYNITGPVRAVVNCHCDSCRKRNGSAYSTYCVIAQGDIAIEHGDRDVATYENAQGARKHFCGTCGTPLYNLNPRYPGLAIVLYGSLLDQADLAPSVNIYCETQLPWVSAIASIKSFDKDIERQTPSH